MDYETLCKGGVVGGETQEWWEVITEDHSWEEVEFILRAMESDSGIFVVQTSH